MCVYTHACSYNVLCTCAHGDCLLQLLSVSYEKFAVALDEKFGQIMWVDFPQTANKGKA